MTPERTAGSEAAGAARGPRPIPAREVRRLLDAPPGQRARVFAAADRARRAAVGDEVFLRGIVEFSNRCARNCRYCGIRAGRTDLRRYAMDESEILDAAQAMAACGVTTVVLQSGESDAFGDARFARLVERIKRETPLAVTGSCGVRPEAVFRRWRDAGMDRYLVRFETSDPRLYARLHPGDRLEARLEALARLRALGVQTGSGFLIGLPGETLETLAENILLCRRLDLDMAGIGPFIPHPATPLGGAANACASDPERFLLALAVLRLAHPRAHIPATTAFDAVFPGTGRNRALQCGANVFMPSFTPRAHRGDYRLYPGKPCVDEAPGDCAACVVGRLRLLGRPIGRGPGHAFGRRLARSRTSGTSSRTSSAAAAACDQGPAPVCSM